MEQQTENYGPPSRYFRLTYLILLLAWFVLALLLIRHLMLEVWEDRTVMDKLLYVAPVDPGPLPDMTRVMRWGDNGTGVKIKLEGLHPIHRAEYTEGYRGHGFNTYLSDRISMRRRLPDFREPDCDEIEATLTPGFAATVIIVFRDERWTALLRTVYSVVDRSPPELLKEIILVDDGSTTDVLRYPRLENYLAVLKNVQVLRLSQPHGVATARMMGARYTSGDVVIFLGSRCECTEGWLFPLLARIDGDHSVVAVPVVDTIDFDTLQYKHQPLKHLKIGSFTWELKTTWKSFTMTPPSASLTQPISVIVDGIFAVYNRHFLVKGGYDEVLQIPDNQNIELSFRLSMCGGGIELVPCSHVGLVRSLPTPVTEEQQDRDINDRVRIAQIWLERYKDFFFERLPEYSDKLADLLSRPQTNQREGLKCHSFTWYLQNQEPSMLLPASILHRGTLMQSVFNQTVLTLGVNKNILVLQDWYLTPTTIWYLTESGELMTDSKMCLSLLVVAPAPAPERHHHTRLEMTFKDLVVDRTNLDLNTDLKIPGKDLNVQENRHLVLETHNLDVLNNRHNDINLETDFNDGTVLHDEGTPRKIGINSLNFEIEQKKKSVKTPMNFDLGSNFVNVLRPPQTRDEGKQLLGRGERSVTPRTTVESLTSYLIELRSCEVSSSGNKWTYTETGALHHQESNQCMEAHNITADKFVLRMATCDKTKQSQMWNFFSRLDHLKRKQDID